MRLLSVCVVARRGTSVCPIEPGCWVRNHSLWVCIACEVIAGQYSAVDSITDSSTPCLFSHADNRCRLFGIDGKRHRSGLTSAYPHPSPPPSIPMTHKLTRVSDASNMPARSFKAQDKAPAQNHRFQDGDSDMDAPGGVRKDSNHVVEYNSARRFWGKMTQ